MKNVDVLIIGASASGLMCAIEAGKRNRRVLVIDHAERAGKKIIMSGGGRCNFTNLDVSAENYLSENPHFAKSALSRYTQWDFIDMVSRYNISYHERSHGQLFCDDSAKDILAMLMSECEKNSVKVLLNTTIEHLDQVADNTYLVSTGRGKMSCRSLVIATGGLSFPKIGATPFGYKIAEQFEINVIPTRAGLVPFTLQPEDKKRFSPLSGIALESVVSNSSSSFRENILFTHRGLSGPAILQVSSYWRAGEELSIDLLPDRNLLEVLTQEYKSRTKQKLKNTLAQLLPKRVIETLIKPMILDCIVADLSQKQIQHVADSIHHWKIRPNGTEGYRTAEVTIGGIDCNEISSKTLEAKRVKGLYFVGEVLDVTGWLGGYNFQWAWSSGWCAGQYV